KLNPYLHTPSIRELLGVHVVVHIPPVIHPVCVGYYISIYEWLTRPIVESTTHVCILGIKDVEDLQHQCQLCSDHAEVLPEFDVCFERKRSRFCVLEALLIDVVNGSRCVRLPGRKP